MLFSVQTYSLGHTWKVCSLDRKGLREDCSQNMSPVDTVKSPKRERAILLLWYNKNVSTTIAVHNQQDVLTCVFMKERIWIWCPLSTSNPPQDYTEVRNISISLTGIKTFFNERIEMNYFTCLWYCTHTKMMDCPFLMYVLSSWEILNFQSAQNRGKIEILRYFNNMLFLKVL